MDAIVPTFDSKKEELKIDVNMWKLLHTQIMVKFCMAKIAKIVLDNSNTEETKGTE